VPDAQSPHEKKVLSWWIRVAESCVNLMAYCIFKLNSKVVVPKSVWAISRYESETKAFKDELADFDALVISKIGDTIKDSDLDDDRQDSWPETPDYIFNEEELMEPEEPEATKPKAADYMPETYDQYSTAEVLLPYGGESAQATVKACKRNTNGIPIGRCNTNPILDTCLYEVEFPDGLTKAIMANLIVENLLSQVYDEGWSFRVLGDIVDHRTNRHALPKMPGSIPPSLEGRSPSILPEVGNLKSSGKTVWLAGYPSRI